MKKELNRKIQTAALVIMFAVMCILKMWVGLLLLFGFAAALTLIKGKKNYCSTYCPLGAIQDMSDTKQNSGRVFKPGILPFLRIFLFAAFWLYLAAVIVINIDNPLILWRNTVLIMIISMSTALIFQQFYKKRTWCVKLCPFSPVLDAALKTRRFVIRSRK
jgi:polyferredoxin